MIDDGVEESTEAEPCSAFATALWFAVIANEARGTGVLAKSQAYSSVFGVFAALSVTVRSSALASPYPVIRVTTKPFGLVMLKLAPW